MNNIIEELDRIEKQDNEVLFIESKANHAIVSVINVIHQINETFSPAEADELKRRLLNSIKGEDPLKFQRKMAQIKKSREK